MAKSELQAAIHEPLTAILSSRAKIAALRVLWKSTSPLPYREIVRRSGMAYRSVELALADLAAVGIITELPGGRERRVELAAAHRLAPPLVALLQAEADFFASVRIELRAWAAAMVGQGLLSAAVVGSVARRAERPGEALQLVVVARDAPAAAQCRDRFGTLSDALLRRHGVRAVLIAYDLGEARKLWRAPTPAARRDVHDAEQVAGEALETLLQSA